LELYLVPWVSSQWCSSLMMPVQHLVASQGPVSQQHSAQREEELQVAIVQLHLEFAALLLLLHVIAPVLL